MEEITLWLLPLVKKIIAVADLRGAVCERATPGFVYMSDAITARLTRPNPEGDRRTFARHKRTHVIRLSFSSQQTWNEWECYDSRMPIVELMSYLYPGLSKRF